MQFAPLEQMLKRMQKNSSSDYELFTELLYLGEFVVKTTVAALVSSIEDDRENHRYRLLHALVRADGIGEWASKLEEVLTGTASQHLAADLNEDRRILTERVKAGAWQYDATNLLHEVLGGIYSATQAMPERASIRAWFTMFAELRNKTRGHGAITPATCAKLAPDFNKSLTLLIENNPIFKRPWAYLHRNLSGKYNVIGLGGDVSAFSPLKTTAAAEGENYPNGVYMYAGRPRRIDLIESDLNASDFFFANGAFNGKTYELHSLISDSRLFGNAAPYLLTAGDRPPSETQGKGELDVLGSVFTNLPSIPMGYVRRPRLEAEVRDVLTNDRHPVVTLVGRGGIGKTSLALSVLHEIAFTDRYSLIIWFSARDIDLTTSGPKVVQPKVLAERDIANVYRTLVSSPEAKEDGKTSALSTMAEHMRHSPLGPTLFIFDNFETVRNPVDLFQWIDTNIRLPNKAVITSRFREFKADFPITVSGMERTEADDLIDQTASSLGISNLINSQRREQIFEESDGHPYVIKIILGEIANSRSYSKPSKLIARKDDILDALFERTYANLSPMAVRIFLALSGWQSLVPQLAVEAVSLWRTSGDSDPEKAIDELIRMSLVDRTRAQDGNEFLGVPLTAALFGRRKLEVSPQRELIEGDIRFLQDVGATSSTGLKEGIRPKILALFKKVAKRISEGNGNFEEVRPMLEFMARSYAPAWLLLADLQREFDGSAGLEKSAEYIRRFLELRPEADEARTAWERLIAIYRATRNVIGGSSAFLRAAEISDPPIDQISSIAHWLNSERDIIDKMDVIERGALFKPLARLMEIHLPEATATDLSRLAWLHLHAGDDRRAREVAEIGLKRDPENRYCQSLLEKLRT